MATDTLEAPRDTYWRRLGEGRFQFQRCARCSSSWLPPREDCPACWSHEWRWEDASGHGKLLSWVIFHTAFHEAFQERLPYNVAIVQLAEGPRLITNIINLPESEADVSDRAVRLAIETDHGKALPRFKLI